MLKADFVGWFEDWDRSETIYWFNVTGQLGDRSFNNCKFGLSDKPGCAVVNEYHEPLKPGSLLENIKPLMMLDDGMRAV